MSSINANLVRPLATHARLTIQRYASLVIKVQIFPSLMATLAEMIAPLDYSRTVKLKNVINATKIARLA